MYAQFLSGAKGNARSFGGKGIGGKSLKYFVWNAKSCPIVDVVLCLRS